MALGELVFTLVGACVVLFCGVRLAHLLMMLSPGVWYPLPENFFTSMGKWAEPNEVIMGKVQFKDEEKHLSIDYSAKSCPMEQFLHEENGEISEKTSASCLLYQASGHIPSLQVHTVITTLHTHRLITGGSDGIGKAYAQETQSLQTSKLHVAFRLPYKQCIMEWVSMAEKLDPSLISPNARQLARRGLNVVIISRSKEKLDRVARDIELKTEAKVRAIAADFTKDNIYEDIKENIEGLDVGILVNNVGILPTQLPCKLLETANLEEKINQVINCNVKAMVKMCHIVLPGMVERGRGIILNVSSGIAKIPCPTYALYAASKAFIERFSQGLLVEYRSSGILIQTVSPFGVSTSMTGHQKPDLITFTAEEFVRNSLMYLKTGEQTYGSVRHSILGWVVQAIPTWVLRSEAFHQHFQEYVKKRVCS